MGHKESVRSWFYVKIFEKSKVEQKESVEFKDISESEGPGQRILLQEQHLLLNSLLV
jgi:hypothetical protein